MAIVAKRFEVHLLDVGQGEAILMDFPDGSFCLLDGGPRSDARGIIEQIEDRINKGRRFRLAGITQWDADHIRGIPAILARFEPQEFRYPGVDLQLMEEVALRVEGDDAATLSSSVRAAIEALPRASRGHFTAPDPIPDMGGVEIHVLSPMPGMDEDLRAVLADSSSIVSALKRFRNRTSVVLWMQVWGRVLFLGGEVEKRQYRDMEEYFLRQHGALLRYRKHHLADWIKLSHHGADGNNPQELFKLFAQSGFVASASAGGGHNHPHPHALKRAHFDYGGRMLCTNLGKGCHRLLTESGLDPRAPESWSDELSALPNPGRPCYRTITITVTDDGMCSTSTQHAQVKCPYGGPPDGVHVW
jgi:competence protein ComEC